MIIHETDIFLFVESGSFGESGGQACRQNMLQPKTIMEFFPQSMVNDPMRHILRKKADLEMQEVRVCLMLWLSMICHDLQ